MNVPVLKLSLDSLREPATARKTLDAATRQIAAALRKSPHYIVIRGIPPTEDHKLSTHLARSLANLPPVKPDTTQQSRDRVSFTKVRIDPKKAGGTGLSTAYSRTNQSLDLHTDSTYIPSPHEICIFQMVRADKAGGDTTMMPVGDIVDALDPGMRAVLERPVFPFGKGPLPILWKRDGAQNIRYYRTQIRQSGGDALPAEELAAMDALDAVLQDDARRHRFHLAAGETIFMQNTKVLHGRTAFAETSDRLMYRIRVHAGCLG